MSRRANRVLAADEVMAALMAVVGPCRLEQRAARVPFEALTHAIAHQQLHGVAAERILGRFKALYGATPFPSPQQLLDTPVEQLRAVGFSYSKIAALRDLAAKTLEGVVPTAAVLATLGDAEIIERLTSVRGIGRWTVEMMLMFDLRRADVLPVGDFGVRNGFKLAYRLKNMPTPKALERYGERWRPFRSAAAWYLWRAVDLARERRLPRCARPPRVAQQKPRPTLAKPAKKTPKKATKRAGRGPRT